MPLSQEEVELGRSDLAIPIVMLLQGFSDQEFTTEEVGRLLIEEERREASVEDIVRALDSLAAQQRVRKKGIAGQQWYNILRRRLGFLLE